MKKLLTTVLVGVLAASSASLAFADNNFVKSGTEQPTPTPYVKKGSGNGGRVIVTPFPVVTKAPDATAEPTTTTKPGTTTEPGATTEPGTTTKPGTTTEPGTTVEPGTETTAPEYTKSPSEQQKPTETSGPIATEKPNTVEIIDGNGMSSDQMSENIGNVEIDVIEVDGGTSNKEFNETYIDTTGVITDLTGDGTGPEGGRYVEYGTYEVITNSPELAEWINNNPDQRLKVRINADLYGDVPFLCVINYGDTWEYVNPEDIVVNGDGTITLTLDKIGAISFFVEQSKESTDVITPSEESDSVIDEQTVAEQTVIVQNPTGITPVSKKPSEQTEYTVDKKNVDYTVVSPQTGYAEWNVDFAIPAALK